MDPVLRFVRALTTDEIRGITHHTGVVFPAPSWFAIARGESCSEVNASWPARL